MDANSNGAGWGGGRRRAHIARPVVLAALLLLAAAVVAPVAGGATRGLVNRRRRGGKPAGPKPLPPIKAVNLDRSAIAPSNHTPTPGALNPELISAELTPPRYCYYNLEGELTQPSVRKPKGGPSLQLSRQIAALLAEPRPCMYYTKYCNANVSENVDMNGDCCFGDRFLRKYKSDKDPNFVAQLPDLAPGSLGSCAIIGNADNLLRHRWGREIDMHDFVVRFNVKMKGYTEHVGTKTGGLWVKPHYRDRKEDGDQKPTKFHINPKYTPPDLAPIDGVPVLVYGPDLNNKWRAVAKKIYAMYQAESKRKGDDVKPTGGWARMIAMVETAALGACTRLDIYGFSSGGGKYFVKNYRVDSDHAINLEHFCHRLIMHTGVKGKVCVYGE
eukprot:jgi/Tetstr1/460596/TSEL_000521.t1